MAKISIDSVVVEELKASGKFYDMVIDHFATMREENGLPLQIGEHNAVFLCAA